MALCDPDGHSIPKVPNTCMQTHRCTHTCTCSYMCTYFLSENRRGSDSRRSPVPSLKVPSPSCHLRLALVPFSSQTSEILRSTWEPLHVFVLVNPAERVRKRWCTGPGEASQQTAWDLAGLTMKEHGLSPDLSMRWTLQCTGHMAG